MTEKKLTLGPSDRDRLKRLMAEKEAAMDAAELSDNELEAQEKAVEAALRSLASRMPPATESEKQAEAKIWKCLEEKIEGPQLVGGGAALEEESSVAKVIPFFHHKGLTSLWVGGLTVAALALLIVLPQGSQIEDQEHVDSFITKSGSRLAEVNCELDVIGFQNSKITVSRDGLGYLGSLGSRFQLGVTCDQNGYFHVDALGPETKVFRNIAVVAGEKMMISPEREPFGLKSVEGWNFTLLLTKDKLPTDLLIPQTITEGEALGSTLVLWSDTILVREDRK